MAKSTDNEITPLTIISDRYVNGFLAFNLELWDVPKAITNDGIDYCYFWLHNAQKYIIGKGDTPQEALDNLKAKLNPAPDNTLIDKFLFLDFADVFLLSHQCHRDLVENLQFIVEQTHCKIIFGTKFSPKKVKEMWKNAEMPMDFYSITPVLESAHYIDPIKRSHKRIESTRHRRALEIATWLEKRAKKDYRYAILGRGTDFFIYQQDYLVEFDKEQGLTRLNANEIVCILNGAN